MAGPTLVASYLAKTSAPGAGAVTTVSFTPSNGEIIVVKAETWSTGTSMGTPTGGGLTYTSRVAYAPGGFREWVGIWTAVVSGSPGAMTISSTPSASAECSILVERWSSAQLDAAPVTTTANAATGAGSTTLTTTAANSVISWVLGDAQSVDPATRAYLGSAVDEGVRDGHTATDGVGYYAYAAVASAGSTSFGLSAPTGQQWAIAGIEVKAASGATPVALAEAGAAAEASAVAATVPLAEAASSVESAAVAATVPLAEAGAGAQTLAVAAAVSLADAGSAAEALSVSGSGTPALGEGGAAAEVLAVVVSVALADAGAAAAALATAPAAAGLAGNAHGPLPIASGVIVVHTGTIAGAVT